MVRSTARYGLIIAALALSLAGVHEPAAGASEPKAQKAPKSERSRAAEVGKLSAAEIMQAGDEASRGGDFGRAMNFYMQALEVEPSADLWYRVGWVYNRLNKKAYAAQAFASAIELKPDYAAAHEELGLVFLENKARGQAAAHLQRAAELEPQRWRSHNALGALVDAEGDHEQARRHYEAALAANPGQPMVLNNLGYSYYLAGDFEAAAEQYRKALESEPGNRAAIANLGLLYARQKYYEQALDTLAGAMDKPKAYNDVGYVAYQNGDLEAAERLLNDAIRLSPSYYATAHKNLKRVRDAIAAAATQPKLPERAASAAKPG